MNQNEIIDFSIITPVYNGGRYLKETIESVLENTSQLSFEYIVINDGSTDETSSILETFKNKIRIVNQINQGQSAAVKKGIELARGKYCMIVNADDPLISPELFQKSKQIFEENKNIVATYPSWVVINSSSKIVKYREVREFSEYELIGNFNCLIGPGGIFRSYEAKQLNGWNTEYRYVPDYEFWLRLSQSGKFQKIPGYLAAWRTHSNSISIGSRSKAMADERIRVIKDFLEKYPKTKNLRKKAMGSAYYSAATLSYFDRNVPGKQWVVCALKLNPHLIYRRSPIRTLYMISFPASYFLRWEIFHKLLKFIK